MARVGVHLLGHALDNACPHFAGCMWRDLRALGHAGRWVAAQSAAPGGSGATLLHRAVASGSAGRSTW